MGKTGVDSMMLREYFSYLCPFLLITWIGFVCISFGSLQKDRRRIFLFVIPAVSVLLTFLPFRGLSLAHYLLSFNPVYSVETTALFAILLIEHAAGKKFLSSRDMVWFSLWNVGISLPLYASSLGFVGFDLYGHGYGFSAIFMVTALVSALLIMAGNNLSYIFIASLAAFDLKALSSDNFFDYLTDGMLFIASLGILVSHGSRLSVAFLRKCDTQVK